MTINYLTFGLAILFALILLWLFFKTGKARKYKVVVGDQLWHVTRDWKVGLNDQKDMTCFRKEDGKLVWLSNHFKIMMEEE